MTAATFHAGVQVSEDGRAWIEVPAKRKTYFPEGTAVQVEAVLWRQPPCLHLTIRERSGGVRSVEIPRTHQDQAKFAAGTPVIIALEDDPAIRVRATVWGGERRFATIRRNQEHAERFEVGKSVAVVIG